MPRLHPHLLEVSAWPWLERLSKQAGTPITLGSVPEDVWDGYAQQGFDVLYLMGIWQRSIIGRELALAHPGLRAEYDRVLPGWTNDDVPGSPYCIADYVPDARMGGWAGVDAARESLRARGMQLMVDFVPNHTAFDHPWVQAHPERYVRGSADAQRQRPEGFRKVGSDFIACGRDPYFPPWTDVAQLNYFNPETRTAMIDVLRTIREHADGVRCDMAMLILNDVFERTWRRDLGGEWPVPGSEFWPAATREVQDLLYLAEVYWELEWTLQQQGFDFTYDKRLLDRLHAGSAEGVRGHLRAEPDYANRSARFLENHDEPRSAVQLGERLPAAATMLATLPGMRFFYDGQMDGARLRAPVQLGRWPEEPADAVTRRLYDRLLSISGEEIFHQGAWELLEVTDAGNSSHSQLVAWEWIQENKRCFVIVNLGRAPADGYVPLRDLPADGRCAFADRLTDATFEVAAETLESPGLYVRLEAGRSHVLSMALSGTVPASEYPAA